MRFKNYVNEAAQVVAKFKKGSDTWEMKKEFRWGGLLTWVIYVNGKETDQLAPNLDKTAALKKFKEMEK
jgi:hypothetical protein